MATKFANPAARLEQQAHSVLDSLDRWDARLQGHQNQKRCHARKKFRTRIIVYVADGDETASEDVEATIVHGWSRDLSAGGIGFISLRELKDPGLTLCLDPEGFGEFWIKARIVRTRKLQDGFHEYGCLFEGRVKM